MKRREEEGKRRDGEGEWEIERKSSSERRRLNLAGDERCGRERVAM